MMNINCNGINMYDKYEEAPIRRGTLVGVESGKIRKGRPKIPWIKV